MSDALYLNLWFPSFDPEEMVPRTLSVLRQFPFSAADPGVRYVAIQPVDWAEPTVLERRLVPPISPEELPEVIGEFAESDYAFVLESYWDLWVPDERAEWTERPQKVEVITRGIEFEQGEFRQEGHIQIEFGLDFPFLYEDRKLAAPDEERVKSNVSKLVEFTHKLEKNCNLRGRVLWSESDENLAQKLIARLQRVQ